MLWYTRLMAANKEMSSQRANGLQPRFRRPLAFLMILTGLALLPFAGQRIIEDVRLYNSPFDQIDYSLENQQGFLPMLDPAIVQAALDVQPDQAPQEEPEPGLDRATAPTLEALPSSPDATLPENAANPGLPPEHLLIPAIDLFVPVQLANYRYIDFEGATYTQWDAPYGYVAGWQTDSAGLGVPGNTVLYGHHNIAGKVFENLYQLKEGQVIQMKSGDELFTYRIVLSMILEEKYQPLEVRLENARWILPSTDERITLITCWPERGNSHRVVVVAVRDEPEAAIPVTGGEAAAVSAGEPVPPAESVATPQTSEPALDPMQFAPPVEGSPEISEASAPDLAANPGLVPERILVPIIGLFYPVTPIENSFVEREGRDYRHWQGPHIVAGGWEASSAGLGVPGNTVIYGWQDVYGAPFKDVHKLLPLQVIQLKSGGEIFNYRIAFTAILEEPCQHMLLGSAGERWVLPSLDERVTLITCYPETAYTHRVVVVALREP